MRVSNDNIADIALRAGFYSTHRSTIVHGHLAPEIRLGHVPLIRFIGSAERIIGVYDDVACAPGGGPLPLWILNASTRPFVELRPDNLAGPHLLRTRDRFGRMVDEREIAFPVACLPVEVGGSLEVCGMSSIVSAQGWEKAHHTAS